jgi:hypothetical protein
VTTRRTYANLIATMLLGGLWHGAAWTFVAWGGLHGGGLAVERARLWRRSRGLLDRAGLATPDPILEEALDSAAAGDPGGDGRLVAGAGAWATVPVVTATLPAIPRRPVGALARRRARDVAAWAVTFHVVCLGWVLFRATSFTNAGEVLGRVFSTGSRTPVDAVVVLVILGALLAQWLPPGWGVRARAGVSAWGVPAQALALAGVVVVIDAFGPSGVAPFIYFRF